MLFLKILIQSFLGISTLIAGVIDYLWHDKRTKGFKRLRTILFIISILSLIGSITITVIDDDNKNEEINLLLNQLARVNEKLIDIKNNGEKMDSKLQPFLKIAAERYPYLDSSVALEVLKSDISNLNDETKKLKKFEYLRQQKETELAELKKTSPLIDISISINGTSVIIKVIFINDIPITKIKYTLEYIVDDEVLMTMGSEVSEMYPPKDKNPVFLDETLGFLNNGSKNSLQKLRITLFFESIYFKESHDPNLKKKMIKIYKYSPL